MDINKTSRVFIDVASKLMILGSAKRIGRKTLSISELEGKSKDLKDKCLLFKPRDVGGYILACDGKVIAIAITNPPKIGEKALEVVDDNPMPGDLYEVPKRAVKDAISKLTASERASKAGENAGKALIFMKNKIAEKKIEETLKSEEEEVEKLVDRLGVQELEIFDLIDTVTLTDEIAYYLGKKGYEVDAETPDELNGYYIAVIRVSSDVPPAKLLNDVVEVAKSCEARNLIKIVTPRNVYYVDPVLAIGLKRLTDKLAIPFGYVYIRPKDENEAELHVVLSSNVTTLSLSKFIDLMSKLVRKRRLPWQNVKVVIETPTSTYSAP